MAKTSLVEARLETEAIEKEKNQLMQNWTSCLIGMKRRDEAFAQMMAAIRLIFKYIEQKSIFYNCTSISI